MIRTMCEKQECFMPWDLSKMMTSANVRTKIVKKIF